MNKDKKESKVFLSSPSTKTPTTIRIPFEGSLQNQEIQETRIDVGEGEKTTIGRSRRIRDTSTSLYLTFIGSGSSTRKGQR